MVFHLLPVIISTFLLVITQSSAHFFPNISSIPPSLIPNKTAWQDFQNFKGCHKGIKQDGLHKMKQYFQYFGYLDTSYNNISSDEFDGTFESAVKFYQQNFNLNTTGELDDSTLSKIVLPRCGNADVVNGTSTMYRNPNSSLPMHAVQHYTFFPNTPRWPADRTDLTYSFVPENQLSEAVRGIFARAFERWSEVTPMTFTETNSTRSDIRIGFYTGDHGDGEPFDGVLGTLAHAFAPPLGRFHLDGDENWITDFTTLNSAGRSGVDLESVAVHEIGHLLGLGHSSIENAIMYPTISTGTRKVELDNDDIAGIQQLYGANPNYNGSSSSLLPRNQRDQNGSIRLGYSWLGICVLLVVGLFSVL